MRGESKWGVAEAGIALLLLAGGVMLALGVQPPQARIAKAEARLDAIEPKVASHDVLLAQMKQEVDDIHDAVVGGQARRR